MPEKKSIEEEISQNEESLEAHLTSIQGKLSILQTKDNVHKEKFNGLLANINEFKRINETRNDSFVEEEAFDKKLLLQEKHARLNILLQSAILLEALMDQAAIDQEKSQQDKSEYEAKAHGKIQSDTESPDQFKQHDKIIDKEVELLNRTIIFAKECIEKPESLKDKKAEFKKIQSELNKHLNKSYLKIGPTFVWAALVTSLGAFVGGLLVLGGFAASLTTFGLMGNAGMEEGGNLIINSFEQGKKLVEEERSKHGTVIARNMSGGLHKSIKKLSFYQPESKNQTEHQSKESNDYSRKKTNK